MRLIERISLLLVLSLACATAASAQNQTQTVENLRAQLQNIASKETELQTRSRQLDEDLKPENIEKYFALNGSTHPEELREQRRRQLEAEKSNITTQLEQLAASRARLEAAIATAEAAAYRQSAGSAPSSLQPQGSVSSNQTNGTSSTRSTHRTRRKHSRRARRAKH
jgi:citrate synthase